MVVVLIIAILIAIAVPTFLGARGVDVVAPAAPGANDRTLLIESDSRSGRAFCLADVTTGGNSGTWYRVLGSGGCPALDPAPCSKSPGDGWTY